MGYFSLVGLPYGNANCYDIVEAFYLLEMDTELDFSYGGVDISDREEVKQLISSKKGEFVKVDEPMFGDVMTMTIFGIECHVGVYIGNGKMLHSYSPAVGCCIEDTSRWRNRITGYYRLKVTP